MEYYVVYLLKFNKRVGTYTLAHVCIFENSKGKNIFDKITNRC